MKVCTRCNSQLQDNEEFCPRCGNRQFRNIGQAPNQMQGQQMQGQQMQRPQGQRNMQRPQGQRPVQGQGPVQGQRPVQSQGPVQRPAQVQGNMRPNMQRPNMQGQQGQGQQMQRPNMQGQQGGFPNQPMPNQQFDGGFDESMFPDTPVQKKKGLFGGKKNVKQPQQNVGVNNNNMMNPTTGMNTGMGTIPNQPINEDGSSVADWIKTLLVFIIPIFGLIKYFMWSRDTSIPAYKKNFCKAMLIYFVACLVLSFVLSFGLTAVISSML